ACIDNEARYNQARQYGFSEKMSFLPGTKYSLRCQGYDKTLGSLFHLCRIRLLILESYAPGQPSFLRRAE
ncbi:MAG: hypothetical protein KZQ59_06175, partial [Candidatus Thiodiazotropha sp. (ex Lucinoma aequizonata)]|nr:hypothetical protein [Candidatus Thiodiazotropha sp. (ex Lucinoma aequizonata)]MCU7899349.1 hypothetical protein [Candidatus Thiodiazotropha sp. (ex Lucinoma aequizonata)]MCU7908611.1 hypothetical protein [Candidatus Thiodiazotropha sp. (ex Lucinoma aequizonata)]